MRLLNKLVKRLSDAKMQSKLYTSGKCKAAFTLAEVLITIAVIGVVAALTMPILINKINKMVWTNQLLKTDAVLKEGFARMLADDKVSSLEDSTLADIIYKGSNKDLEKYLKKYFNIVAVEGNKIKLANGATMDDQCFNNGAECVIDINGDKGPNIYGRDRFYFFMRYTKGYCQDCSTGLLPIASRDWARINIGDDYEMIYWKTTDEPELNCTEWKEDIDMVGCTARVLEERAMNY